MSRSDIKILAVIALIVLIYIGMTFLMHPFQ